MSAGTEASRRFDCFGGAVTVHAAGDGADVAARRVRGLLRGVHVTLSRFLPDSELSRLNADPRATVPASPLMRAFARAATRAGELSGGLVDATLLEALERHGYTHHWERERALPVAAVMAAGRAASTAAPHPAARWRLIEADDAAGTITRPPGVRLDSGGVAKGLAADLAGRMLRWQPTFAVDCCGDIRIGGTAGLPRTVRVDDPFGDGLVDELAVVDGAVATSGVSRRTWRRPDGRPAHHLIDPATGDPAHTGVVQVTALAPSAFEAEVRAKAALLAGPDAVPRWLSHGGVAVLDDRSLISVPAPNPTCTVAA